MPDWYEFMEFSWPKMLYFLQRCFVKWNFHCASTDDISKIFDKFSARKYRCMDMVEAVFEMCKLMSHFDAWLRTHHPERYLEYKVKFQQGQYDKEMVRVITTKRSGFKPEELPFLAVSLFKAASSITTFDDKDFDKKLEILTDLVKGIREEMAQWKLFSVAHKSYLDQKNGALH